MRDIVRLLRGEGPREDDGEGGAAIWDGRRGRRPSIADSREWCGTEPDGEALGQLARALRSPRQHDRGRARAGRAGRGNRGIGPF
ncbi:MAG TPA: hypothetical protein VMG38_12135 [Trebonia sp.]|nr:hypothetical protein [Trebonia sp.]